MNEFGHILLIVNPVSGQARGLRVSQQIRKVLENNGVVCSVRVTNGQGDAERWSRTAAESGFDAVIVVGGDGTVGEAVAGQAQSQDKVPVALVPVGTANVISIALNLPLFPGLIKSNVLAGRVVPFDVGYLPAHDRYFLLMAAIGYPAEVIKDSPRRLKNLFGIFTYLWAGFRNALNLGEVDIFIEDEGGRVQEFSGNTILLANIGKIGEINLKVNPNTSAHDGKFDVTVISSRSFWQLGAVLFKMLTWRYKGATRMNNFQSSHVTVRTDPPVEVQIDGENIGLTPLEATIIPQGVRIIVGPRYKDDALAALSES